MYEPNEPYEKVWLSGRAAVREAVEWMILYGSPKCLIDVMVNMCDRRGLTVRERNHVLFGTDCPWKNEPLFRIRPLQASGAIAR